MSYGNVLRHDSAQRAVIRFSGVYDVSSTAIAAQHGDTLFVSGFGFAASDDRLPDVTSARTIARTPVW